MLRLKELRKAKNMTMKKLGEKIGVAESTISLYENGRRQPDHETLVKLAKYFNVSVDFLLGNNIEPEEISIAKKRTSDLLASNEYQIANIESFLGTNYGTLKSWCIGFGDFFNDKIAKLADLFDVSVDYLLGRTDDPHQKPSEENIKFDEFTYEMYNESKELTEEDKQALLGMARLLKSKINDNNGASRVIPYKEQKIRLDAEEDKSTPPLKIENKKSSLANSGEIAAEGGELNSAPKKRKKETTL